MIDLIVWNNGAMTGAGTGEGQAVFRSDITAGAGRPGALSYRADLDGMRAVAVLAVVVYHMNADWLPGGFVGVDVFFVLSGFFITQLLARDFQSGQFDLLDFYDRRIRRLLPALIAMMTASTAMAAFLMMPAQFEAYGRHLVAALFSVSNVVFWTESGYFAADVETLPLLHTWSLAVEEQFYLVFPIALFAVWRRAQAWVIPCVAVMALGSFFLSVWLVQAYPAAAFYLAPSRIWELALGALLALGAVAPPTSVNVRGVAGSTGLVMVLASFVLIDASTPFPGPGAVLPCLGTALVIWAGLGMAEQERKDLAAILLSARPMVWIGLLSYSLYLWHWPVLVYGRMLHIGPMDTVSLLGLVPIMAVLTYLSWRFVEQPFRHARRVWPERRHRWTVSAAAVTVLGVAGLSANAMEGYPQRVAPSVDRLMAAARDNSPERNSCHAKVRGADRFGDRCRFGPRNGKRVIVFSDSHGTELSYVLGQVARAEGLRVTQVTGSACPPALGFSPEMRPDCARHTERMLSGMVKQPPSTVLVQAYYELWQEEPTSAQFWSGLEDTVVALKGAGHRVIVLGPVPRDPNGPVPETLARLAQRGVDPIDYRFAVSPTIRADVQPRLEGLVARTGAAFIGLMPTLCGSDTSCPGLVDGAVIYFDDHHLSVTVARQVADALILPALK